MLINIARKSLIMIEPFIAVTFLYLSNTDIFLMRVFKSTLIKVTTEDIPIYATYLKTVYPKSK